jgi:hypothetical protein
MTALDWAFLGVTVCSLWLLLDFYRFMLLALGSGFTSGTERREFQFGTGVATALAFFVSAIVAALFNFDPLILPLVVSVFASIVTSGVGVAYAAILLTRALGWVVRHLRSVS